MNTTELVVEIRPEKKIQAVGLLAQLVERCTSIAEVIGSNPIQAWIFFRSYFNY